MVTPKKHSKTIQILLMAAGIVFGVYASASIFSLNGYSKTINFATATGICFALLKAYNPQKSKLAWASSFALWIILGILLLLKLKTASVMATLFGILAACLLSPLLLVSLFSLLPIKQLYKDTFFAALAPFLAMITTGVWGNHVIVAAMVAVTIPVFYYITRNSTAKDKRIQFTIFLAAIFLTHFFGYLPFVIPRLVAFLLALLSVLLLEKAQIKLPSEQLALIPMTMISIPLAYIGSANVFTYLVANECHSSIKEPFPLSYTFVTTNGDTLNERTLQGKNVAIMFWSSRCANCHKELPYFSRLGAQYENDTNNCVIAAFIPFDKENDAMFYERETAHLRHLICAQVMESEKLMKDLGFNTFPHVTYLNKQGKVVYNGYLSNRPWIFAYNPKKYLGK